MDANMKKFDTIDEYIARFPADVQVKLQTLRQVIRDAAPHASEKISYQMPTFSLHGNLVHFAAYEHHIGFYPAPSAISTFSQQLTSYKSAKGSVQFPLDLQFPWELISEMVKFRVNENIQKVASKKKKS